VISLAEVATGFELRAFSSITAAAPVAATVAAVANQEARPRAVS